MKGIVISSIIAAVLIVGAIVISRTEFLPTDNVPANNVSIVDGKQIIEIQARGGYQPRKSVAKAGIDTVIRFNTKGTFDCSSSVSIPSLGISKLLPQTGSTDIQLGVADLGVLNGTCGMGMYPFEIEFQT